MEKSFEVAIIGASLAGASLALHLQRAGISCLLTDKHTFPRRKACGEALSILGIRELEELGLGSELRALPHAPFAGFHFLEKGKARAELLPLPQGWGHGIGVQRFHLDQLLLNKFRSARPGLFFSGKQELIKERADGSFIIHTEKGEFKSRYLALATGSSSRLPLVLGVPVRERSRARSALCLALRIDPLKLPPVVTLYLDGNLQACCTPVDKEQLNISILASSGRCRELGKSEFPYLLQNILRALELEAELCEEPLAVSDIGCFHRSALTRNIFVVGDALDQLDPIGRMGMAQALISARITGKTLHKMLRGTEAEAMAARTGHRRNLRSALRMLNGYTRLSYLCLANRLSQPFLGRFKAGALAREMLLKMHDLPRSSSTSMISSMLVNLAGRL